MSPYFYHYYFTWDLQIHLDYPKVFNEWSLFLWFTRLRIRDFPPGVTVNVLQSALLQAVSRILHLASLSTPQIKSECFKWAFWTCKNLLCSRRLFRSRKLLSASLVSHSIASDTLPFSSRLPSCFSRLTHATGANT